MRTVDEWSAGFDLFYQNINSGQAPGIEEVEKSRILTMAEYSVAIALYNGTLGKPFESTEEVTAYLSPLVKQAVITTEIDPLPSGSGSGGTGGTKQRIAGRNSHIYKLPSDLLFRTYESCQLNKGTCTAEAVIVPVTQDEFARTYRNPFKGPNGSKVLRLDYSEPVVNNGIQDKFMDKYSELVSKYPIDSYLVRYLSRPKPIILESGDSIDGYDGPLTCELDEALHQAILNEAVRLAKAIWAA